MITPVLLHVLASSPTSAVPDARWGACPDDDVEASCTVVSVPRVRESGSGDAIDVHVKRILAPSGDARGQLWFLTGGEGPHQHFVPVPEAFHVTLNEGACPISLIADFIADPEAPIDPSCVSEMPRVGFGPNAERDQVVWGTEDRWGTASSCRTSPAPVALTWWLLPLLACFGRRR